MYIDSQALFSDSQALTASAVGTNVIDLTQARSIGNGEPIAVAFVVEVAADQGTGDEDYTFRIEYASNAAQSTGQKKMGERVFESGTPAAPAQDADLLVAGFRFYIPVPPTVASEDEQYLGVRYVLVGTTPSITMSAFVIPMSMIESRVDYSSGYSIS